MQVVLMRHGEAARAGAHADVDRPLTAAGRDDVLQVARGLARLGARADALLTSPALRCRETAEILATELRLPAGVPRVLDALAAGTALERLQRALGSIGPMAHLLVVGHEPELAALGSMFLAGLPRPALRLRCGACACFELDSWPPTAGSAVLLWLVTPEQMRFVARASGGG